MFSLRIRIDIVPRTPFRKISTGVFEISSLATGDRDTGVDDPAAADDAGLAAFNPEGGGTPRSRSPCLAATGESTGPAAPSADGDGDIRGAAGVRWGLLAARDMAAAALRVTPTAEVTPAAPQPQPTAETEVSSVTRQQQQACQCPQQACQCQ
eukprot:CAMPEP_0114564004 /NCGR_PEP_ID=MMETSP0114-20121206/13448_1 /TAXON_ID=31324 /ORGANISM="Goniomonas sp, Strain m" /LENGTH=152 /DNA_ID=CAMNT_0001749961 /DNA_START=220 /DNA_END=679 /DNA_ORIENTATION=+